MANALPEHLARIAEGSIVEAIREWRNALSARRAVCLALGLYGLRGLEVSNLNRGDLDTGRGVLRVRTVKRGRHRAITLDPLIAHALLKINSGQPKTHPMLVTQNKQRLHTRSIGRYGRWLSRLLKTPCSFHSLRHTAAHRAYAETGDVYTVHRLLGHKTLHQTHVYLQTATPVPIETGPRFNYHTTAPELHVYDGPPDNVQRRASFRRRLVEGRLPPPRGARPPHNQRAAYKQTLGQATELIASLSPDQQHEALRTLLLHAWPEAAKGT